MKKGKHPILEFDPDRRAALDPTRVIEPIDISEYCVLCFFQDVIDDLVESGEAEIIANQKSEIGTHPVYEFHLDGQRLALFHPGIGAALAAGFLEELIALGCRKFIGCGGAGILDKDINVGNIIIPVSAIRDEGTSYHYLPPGLEVSASPEAIAAMERVLSRHEVDDTLSKTWTTDAIYRETTGKVQLRKSEGCLTVEMEAAALFAVAHFRGVIFGQMLYAGDDVSGTNWDSRLWTERNTIRQRLLQLAAEACLDIRT